MIHRIIEAFNRPAYAITEMDDLILFLVYTAAFVFIVAMVAICIGFVKEWRRKP